MFNLKGRGEEKKRRIKKLNCFFFFFLENLSKKLQEQSVIEKSSKRQKQHSYKKAYDTFLLLALCTFQQWCLFPGLWRYIRHLNKAGSEQQIPS